MIVKCSIEIFKFNNEIFSIFKHNNSNIDFFSTISFNAGTLNYCKVNSIP